MPKYQNLKNFKRIEVEIDLDSPIRTYAEKCVDVLHRTSPRGDRKSNNYADTWVVNYDKKRKGEFSGTVWNEENYRLTHLLENGHLIVNKKNGVGWANANPHIDKAYQQLKDPFIKAMQDTDIKVK